LKNLKKLALAIFVIIGLLLANYFAVFLFSTNKIYSKVTQLAPISTALILGAGKNQTFAPENFAFTNRMKATIQLFKNHKDLNKIIVSGKSNVPNYNEPNEMKTYLVKMGVDASMIYKDHGGTRTYFSILQARDYYKESDIIIVSQKLHLQRAVFMSNAMGLNAIGFVAKELPQGITFNLFLRELLARAKATFEIIKQYIFKQG